MKVKPEIGEFVTHVHWNGAREGVIWQVLAHKGSKVRIDPIFTVTGPSILKAKWVHYSEIELIDLVTLGSSRAQIDIIIQELVRRRSSEVTA